MRTALQYDGLKNGAETARAIRKALDAPRDSAPETVETVTRHMPQVPLPPQAAGTGMSAACNASSSFSPRFAGT